MQMGYGTCTVHVQYSVCALYTYCMSNVVGAAKYMYMCTHGIHATNM